MEEHIFLSGSLPEFAGPLGRYLPPIPAGVCAAWLANHSPPGSWILDPFGASPRAAVEAARAGYRVLIASNNPIDRFLIDLTANPPSETELRSSLADLGVSFKGDQRIEPHLRSLYLTTCNHCQNKISAQAFIWDRDAPFPHSRVYHCPHCGDAGEFPLPGGDDPGSLLLPSGHLHRARALERVTPRDDPDRGFVEEALDVYMPRALYALFTLVNKLDSLPAPQRRSICALLLAAFDQANTLWPHPGQRSRPRQLIIPPRYRENNVWLSLEEAVGMWAAAYPAVEDHLPVTTWPQLPPERGGICIFDGRVKDLVDCWEDTRHHEEKIAQIRIEAVIAVLPRPNQAYWTLSTLWSGWLWGRESAAGFKTVLRRRRYDWTWHCAALYSAFSNLVQLLQEPTPIFGLIGESEAGFLTAAILAAGKAGLSLEGIALREATEQTQIVWQSPVKTVTPPGGALVPDEDPVQENYQQAGLDYLRLRGEPASYLELHTAGLAGLAGLKTISAAPLIGREDPPGQDQHDEFSPTEYFVRINAELHSAFSYRMGFVRFHGSQKNLETGQWWLRESALNLSERMGDENKTNRVTASADIAAPLSDRVEIEFVRLLVKSGGLTFTQIDKHLLNMFSGLFTPDPNLIEECCDSYTEPIPGEQGMIHLRNQETPALRRSDLAAITALLLSLGRKLNFVTKQPIETERWVTWSRGRNQIIYAFYPTVSARLGNLLLQRNYPVQNCILVYPGGRAGLIQYKLRQDARMQAFFAQGWRFVKFRHVRFLAENKLLSQDNLDEQLTLDPMAKQDPQMTFL